MRRSRKPVWAVSSIEGSNPSLSVSRPRICLYAGISRLSSQPVAAADRRSRPVETVLDGSRTSVRPEFLGEGAPSRRQRVRRRRVRHPRRARPDPLAAARRARRGRPHVPTHRGTTPCAASWRARENGRYELMRPQGAKVDALTRSPGAGAPGERGSWSGNRGHRTIGVAGHRPAGARRAGRHGRSSPRPGVARRAAVRHTVSRRRAGETRAGRSGGRRELLAARPRPAAYGR